MKGLIIRWAILTGMLFFVPHLVAGIQVTGVKAAFLAVFGLALANALVRPFLFLFKLFTFPLNFLTLGLFALGLSLLVNILIFWLVGWKGEVVSGFQVDSFNAALKGALILSVANMVASHLVKDRDDEEERDRR